MTVPSKIFDEFVGFITGNIAADEILGFKPSSELQSRVEKLIAQEKEVGLSNEEKYELDQYVMLEHIFVLAKSKARQLKAS